MIIAPKPVKPVSSLVAALRITSIAGNSMREFAHLTPFADVDAVLNTFRDRISELLRSRFVGMYVVGSLALGDFDPDHSDIDFVVVTDMAIGDEDFRELQEMHADFDVSDSPWAGKIEAVYASGNALRSPAQNGEQYPQIEKGTALFKSDLEDGWVFQLATLREQALVVSGPDPRTLIDPINPQDVRAAVAAISGLWLEQARDDLDWLAWVSHRGNQVFVILTLCRMLYSLRNEAVVSKLVAARWVQRELDRRWTTLVAASLAKRYESQEVLDNELDETIAFVRYTFDQSTSL
jgi:hypothetical protein